MFGRLYVPALVLAVVFASWAALGFGGGAAAAIILLATVIHGWAAKLRLRRAVRVAASMLWLLALACLLMPAARAARDAARGAQCMNNLKQIGLALRNYRDCHGRFPP